MLQRLSADLTGRFGRGFWRRNLQQMRLFYRAGPPQQIRQTASGKSATPPEFRRQLSAELTSSQISRDTVSDFCDLPALAQAFPLPWSAYVRLLSVKRTRRRAPSTKPKRCAAAGRVRQLDRQIDSQFYERTALSRNKAAMLQRPRRPSPVTPSRPSRHIKDPFVLEFLNLKDEYSESDLEDALIQHLADFLLELGDDFTFVGRQRRLRIDDSWFRVDLLFFHRRLTCLLVIDLKIGKFSHADAGQMHMYLNYAREHWTKPGENPPVGLILCARRAQPRPTTHWKGCPTRCWPPSTGPCFRMKSCWKRSWTRRGGNWRRGV